MTAAPPAGLPALVELSAAIARRELSSAELVERCLARVAAREDDVQAWAHLDAGLARAQARARDAEAPRGPLHGIPVAIKDIIDTADLPTERGTVLHGGRRPEADAVCVARLRAAGAVVLGKTVTTELATWAPSATRNPWDLSRTPGGSSSGSAAAVADGMVPLAVGTQTVGSTIRPAAFCGVVALKPTHGTASLAGVLLHSPHLDTLGAMGTDPGGVAVLWRVLADPPVSPARPLPAAPRVALSRTPWCDRAGGEAEEALQAAAGALRARGARVQELDLPPGFAALPAAHMVVTEYGVAPGARRVRRRRADHARPAELIARGPAPDGRRPRPRAGGRPRRPPEVDLLWADHDACSSPRSRARRPPLGPTTGDPIFCQPWSLLGHPAATVPAGTGRAACPSGCSSWAPAATTCGCSPSPRAPPAPEPAAGPGRVRLRTG
jgi:amidase